MAAKKKTPDHDPETGEVKDKKDPSAKIPMMRKITAKNVMTSPIKSFLKDMEDGDVKDLFQVTGVITRCRTVSTQFGESTGFKGRFLVQNLITKTLFQGGEFFAPGTLEDELLTAFQTRADGAMVEFGSKISIQADETVNMGYAFVAEPLFDAGAADALAGLAQRAFGRSLAQLTARS